MILRINRMHECVRPTHHLKRSIVFPNEISDNLDAMASHVNDSTTTPLVPDPRTNHCGDRDVSRGNAPIKSYRARRSGQILTL